MLSLSDIFDLAHCIKSYFFPLVLAKIHNDSNDRFVSVFVVLLGAGPYISIYSGEIERE